ncbi:MAG: PIN domain-containing protein [Candidatus Binatia bacterium]
MPAFLPDTSCIIAATCGWHEHHERAAAELERRLARRETMAIAAPALVEAYAVLTRLPAPHRLRSEVALALLEANFIAAGKLVALDARTYRALLREAPRAEIRGGRTYDAVIAACALRAKVGALLTFNEQHFLAFADRGMRIVVP